MLSNEKYIGVVRLLSAGEHQEHYVSENNHPAIISKEQFEAVQMEKKKRSNVVKGEVEQNERIQNIVQRIGIGDRFENIRMEYQSSIRTI